MAESSTLTFRLDDEVKAKLGRLAEHTRRSRSFLAGEAVAAYVDRELAVIEAIQDGRADLAAGRVHTQDAVFTEARAIVEAARAKR